MNHALLGRDAGDYVPEDRQGESKRERSEADFFVGVGEVRVCALSSRP